MPERNPYMKYMSKKGLPPVKSHQVIYVPKLLAPLCVESLWDKRQEILAKVDPQFFIKKRPFDPTYY